MHQGSLKVIQYSTCNWETRVHQVASYGNIKTYIGSELCKHQIRVSLEPVGNQWVLPAALIFEHLWQIPVIKSDLSGGTTCNFSRCKQILRKLLRYHGLNTGCFKRGNQILVVLDAQRVGRTNALRNNARPRNRKPVVANLEPILHYVT